MTTYKILTDETQFLATFRPDGVHDGLQDVKTGKKWQHHQWGVLVQGKLATEEDFKSGRVLRKVINEILTNAIFNLGTIRLVTKSS